MDGRRWRRAASWAVLGWLGCGPVGSNRAGEPTRRAARGVETVRVLDAERRGLLDVDVHGTGGYGVRVTLRNEAGKALKVVMPPGLVAANVADPAPGPGPRIGAGPGRPVAPVVPGDPGPGPGSPVEPGSGPGAGRPTGPGAGGPYQDMGLGATTNHAGGFGQFRTSSHADAFGAAEPVDPATGAVDLPAGEAVTLTIPAICLNHSVPAPPARARLRLKDVDDFSGDPRVRRSLRALATVGTSMGVAQAVMWSICNGLTAEQMLARDREINPGEMAVAARFLRAVDADPAAGPIRLDAGRVFVSVAAPHHTQLVARLSRELKGMRLLGLPVEVLPRGKEPRGLGPILHVGLTLAGPDAAKATGKLAVRVGTGLDDLAWSEPVAAELDEPVALAGLETASLARAVDRALVAAFVDARAEKGSTTWEIRNRLPFTLDGLTFRVDDAPRPRRVDVAGLGIGPGRTVRAALPAPAGTIERIELNGL